MYAADVCDNNTTVTQRADSISVPAGAVVVLKPGGCRIVLEDLVAPLTVDSTIDVRLGFASSGTVDLVLPVKITPPPSTA